MLTGKDNKQIMYYDWIDIVLETTLADGRHRIIDRVLAPYLINVKHFSIDKAVHIIVEWVERCEAYEPMMGNVNAFIVRSCYNAQKYKRRPKDLSWFRDNYKLLYNTIASIAESYGIILNDGILGNIP